MFDHIRNRDGKRIFAVIDYPRGKGPFSFGSKGPSPNHRFSGTGGQDRWGAVLIVHGFKGSSAQRHIQGISDALVDAGFLTIRPDLTKNPGRSYMEFADMTYRGELEDCQEVFDYLLKMDEVDKNKIGIAGHSLAGMIVSEIAAERNEICALAILSGVYSFKFVAEHIFSKPFQKAKKEFNQKGWTSVWSQHLEKRLKIKRGFYEDIVQRTAGDFVGKIKCPTLVVSSGADEAVSQNHADLWMKNLGTRDKHMEIIEGSDHNYSGEALNKVAPIVANWFADKLTK